MQTTLAFIQDDRATLHLYCYADFHRYEMTYIVAIAYGGKHTAKAFKSFKTACKWFNDQCDKIGAPLWKLW